MDGTRKAAGIYWRAKVKLGEPSTKYTNANAFITTSFFMTRSMEVSGIIWVFSESLGSPLSFPKESIGPVYYKVIDTR